jgi:hypothetical protein
MTMRFLAYLLYAAALPALSQQAIAAPATGAAMPQPPAAQPAPVDPQRLAVAREIALAFWPDGTIQKMMGSMTGMQSGMMSQMFNKTPKDLGVEADKDAKDGDKTLGEYVREKDPHFEERMAITSRIMHEEIGKMMGQMEPQLRESLATLYARRFSMTELNDIAAFFRTPSGRNYAIQMIPMMSDPEYLQSMAGLAPKLMQGMPAIFERVKKETAHLPPPPDDEESAKDAELPSA